MRLDQQPASTNFNGSGLPMPANGSLITASTSSRIRRATFRSVPTQYFRSSRNSGWKTASCSTDRAKSHLPPQLVHRFRLAFRAGGALQCSQQALGIPGGAQQVCRFQQASKLLSRDQGHVLGVPAADNDYIVIVGNLVQDGSQPFPQARVCRLYRHPISPRTKRTGFLYVMSSTPCFSPCAAVVSLTRAAPMGYSSVFRSPASARLKVPAHPAPELSGSFAVFSHFLGEFRDVNLFPQRGNCAQVVCH